MGRLAGIHRTADADDFGFGFAAGNAHLVTDLQLCGFVGGELADRTFLLTGAVIGARLALLKGNGFIRRAFLVIVSLLILKTARDAFWL